MTRMISIVIPVYRSSTTLVELHERINQVFRHAGLAFEIVFVEDCGGDDSWAIIQDLARRYPGHIRGFQMSRNYGQHNALLCGIRAAKGDIIVTMDDDLQHRPETIPQLLDRLNEGFDVVYGAPAKQQHGLLRDMASFITKLTLEGAMGTRNARKVGAFRAFRTELRNAFSEYRSPTVSIDVLLTWATTKFSAVTVRHDRRKQGQSGYTASKLIRHALNMMTGFSVRPLQLASVMGFGFALFGGGVLIYVLIQWFIHGQAVPGFTFLASIIAIFSGAQLLALGLFGEYLARMHFRTMERPPYSVRNRTDDTA